MKKSFIDSFYLIFCVTVAALTLGIVFNMVSLSLHATSLPTSDYFNVIVRYSKLLNHEINIFDFVLQKHADHNHAFVYLLGLIDIVTDDGRLRILHWAQIGCYFVIFGLLLYVAFSHVQTTTVRYVLLLFIASQLFSIQGAETWIFPFQVVLPSFYLFFLVALFLFCWEVTSEHSIDYLRITIAQIFALIASLSHGAGVAVFPLFIVLGAFCLKGVERRNVISMTAFGFLIFCIHEAVYSSQSGISALQLLERIPVGELWHIPYYEPFLLGHFFAWGAGGKFQVFTGAIGIAFWIYLLWIFLRVRKRDVPLSFLFFFVYATFALIASLMSVLLNLSYMKFRGITPPPALEYFVASRYLITTAGFWIGIAVAGLSCFKAPASFILCLCLVIHPVLQCYLSGTGGRFGNRFWTEKKLLRLLFQQVFGKNCPRQQ